MDETYPIYLNRVARMTLPETYRTQVQFVQESPKFESGADGQYRAKSFQGYTIMTPPWVDVQDESATQAIYQSLEKAQQQLVQDFGSPLFIPVPPQSFHLTLADLIWDSAFRDAIAKNPDFETKLQAKIAESFDQATATSPQHGAIQLQMLGLTLMPRAIAACFAPTDEAAHNRIAHLRRLIYQNSDLMALGIEQQYGFSAHITLGYFGPVPEDFDPESVCETLTALNDTWLGTRNLLDVRYAELRKFEDMTHYHRQKTWPVYTF